MCHKYFKPCLFLERTGWLSLNQRLHIVYWWQKHRSLQMPNSHLWWSGSGQTSSLVWLWSSNWTVCCENYTSTWCQLRKYPCEMELKEGFQRKWSFDRAWRISRTWKQGGKQRTILEGLTVWAGKPKQQAPEGAWLAWREDSARQQWEKGLSQWTNRPTDNLQNRVSLALSFYFSPERP